MARPLVLFLEPDRDTAEMYGEYFALRSWRVEWAADGASGIAKAIAARPDVIATELRLPIMDGLRAIEILRADQATSSIPIVAVTADAQPDCLKQLSAAGCAAVLTKPCLPDRLFRELESAIQQGRSLRRQSKQLVGRAADLMLRSAALGERVERSAHRARALSVKTTSPDAPPPMLNCPSCATLLAYEYSVIGGVSTHREQWDYLRCPNGCGTFQYRQRTRRVRPA